MGQHGCHGSKSIPPRIQKMQDPHPLIEPTLWHRPMTQSRGRTGTNGHCRLPQGPSRTRQVEQTGCLSHTHQECHHHHHRHHNRRGDHLHLGQTRNRLGCRRCRSHPHNHQGCRRCRNQARSYQKSHCCCSHFLQADTHQEPRLDRSLKKTTRQQISLRKCHQT